MQVSHRRDMLRNFSVSPEFCIALYSATHARTNSSGVSLSGVGDGSLGLLVTDGDGVGSVDPAVDDASPLHAVRKHKNRARVAHPTFRTTRTSRDQTVRVEATLEPKSRPVAHPFPTCGEALSKHQKPLSSWPA